MKQGELLINYRLEDGASLPRTGDSVHLGDDLGTHKVVNVVRDYSMKGDGDTVDGDEEIYIDVVDF